MKRITVVNKNTQSNAVDVNAYQHESGFRYLYWLFIAVLVISVLSLVSSVYSGSGEFENYLDSVNSADIIYFDYGKYELKENSFKIIDKIAEQMKNDGNIILNINGYTDNKGSESFNQELSVKRSNAVREYLISKGIDGSKLIITGRGEYDPVNDNSTDIKRNENRRVEFSVSNVSGIRNTGKNAIDNSKGRRFYADATLKNQYVNSKFTVKSRDEITADLSIRDSSGTPVDSVKIEDITANLKWDSNGKIDSTEGYPRLIPINDKKKIAFSLTMDYSGSMYGTEDDSKTVPKSGKIIAMEKSVKVFIDQLGSNMYCKIIKFGEKVLTPIQFTKSKSVLYSVLEYNSYPMGGTALFSSIYTALSDTMFQSNPTVMKTIIAFTDGMENSSVRVTIDSIYNKSLLTNTKIFTVGLYNDVGNYKPNEDEIARRKIDMLKIAQNTGGFFYQANDPDKLNQIYKNIFNQVMMSYNISIVWNSDKLPPKGTNVKAELKINVKGTTRVIYTNYVME